MDSNTKQWLFRTYYKHLKYLINRKYDELALVFIMLNKTVNKGIMFDVGSHFGESARPFLMLGWTVYAFEPDPDINKSSRLHNLEKAFSTFHLYDLAISDVDDQELPFFASSESTGISSLLSFTRGHREVKKARTRTLNRFAKDTSIGAIDFLKVDTEGNDLNVLKGCALEQFTPKVVLCEFEDNKTKKIGHTYTDIGNYLIDHGYDVFMSEWYPIERYGIEHKWRCIKRYPCETEDPVSWGNFIAVNNEYANTFTGLLKKRYRIDIKRRSNHGL